MNKWFFERTCLVFFVFLVFSTMMIERHALCSDEKTKIENPQPLITALANPSSAAENGSEWVNIIHSPDQTALENAFKHIESVNRQLSPDVYGFEELKAVKLLLYSDDDSLKRSDLIGKWKCRSIQVNERGVFSYPYFRCRIKEKEGGLFFEKITGSQRRSGLLFEKNEYQFLFLGTWTVNEEPQQEYSGLQEKLPSDHDSVGLFMKRPSNRIIAILDPDETSYELYEMVKY